MSRRQYFYKEEKNVFSQLELRLACWRFIVNVTGKKGRGAEKKTLFWNLQEAERPSVGAWDKVEPVYSVPNKVVE